MASDVTPPTIPSQPMVIGKFDRYGPSEFPGSKPGIGEQTIRGIAGGIYRGTGAYHFVESPANRWVYDKMKGLF